MGIKWKDFEMPREVVWEEETLTNTYGKFSGEPFERGYGMTIGNSLRRILLSSIEGSAVTSIKLDGVLHEFTTVEGVTEDVTEIVLNVKQLVVRCHSRQSKTVSLITDKKGPITAGMIESTDQVEILNPDLVLATLTRPERFAMELEVGRGRGYVPAEGNKRADQPIGVIAVDSIFSPVRRVSFKVEDARVGHITDYDRLIMEIETNGSVTPKEALLHASNILRAHLDIFLCTGELPPEVADDEEHEFDRELYEKLKMSVSELELSVRSANCLREAGIKSLAELVTQDENEMLKYRNFGKKSLGEISATLELMGLRLGMDIDTSKLVDTVSDPGTETV
ncbi:MAG: DNA-directed RNA polymerase subunit alpha [Candidatus Omnitrophica bacterium]|nr:DNA-directed RNA polymerase subunit alpha [Candidatus Omnitrophota bacterium]